MVNSLMTEKSEYMFGYILEKKSSLKRKLLFSKFTLFFFVPLIRIALKMLHESHQPH